MFLHKRDRVANIAFGRHSKQHLILRNDPIDSVEQLRREVNLFRRRRLIQQSKIWVRCCHGRYLVYDTRLGLSYFCVGAQAK